MNLVLLLTSQFLLLSCSLVGIQKEESPKYKVLNKEKNFEIREYAPYIIAKVTVKGDFHDSSSEAFKILAGYIFGKNKGKKKISMTSPVEIDPGPLKIAMTSPVEMNQAGDIYTMAFSMPIKFTIQELPDPLDQRIVFEEVKSKIVGAHRFSWFSSQYKNDKKAQDLREWLSHYKEYNAKDNYTYAGYNPPWTLPFLRRNEIFIKVQKK